MRLAFIVAHDPNLVIGKDGGLPWHYPEDLKFFKQVTMGHPMLMGRKVFESLNEQPLPGREHVVLSRTRTYGHVPTFSSMEDALEYLSGHPLVFVIGGGEIYKDLLPKADLLYITEIHKEYEGDTWFPEYRGEISTTWIEIRREDHEEISFVVYERR